MKKIFLIITGILIFVSVPVIVFFVGQQQEMRSKAAPATTLSIQPNVNTIPVGETVVCRVIINTGENKVASAKVSLLFDQTKFEAQSITNGTLAPRILNQGTVGVGTATITVAAESTAKPITGQGDISVLRLKAIGGSIAPVAVQFAPDTFVAGIGEKPVNVLVSNQPGSIMITGGSPVASPTPLSSTPTPTPKQLESLFTQPASSSALTLYVHTEATRAGKPLIQGTAPAGSTVTLAIHTTPPQTFVVTADALGNWEATPASALKTGTYTLVASALHPTAGTSETLSTTFTIGGGVGGMGVSEVNGEELPESGSTDTTRILLLAAGVFVVFGVISLRKTYL